MSHSRPRFPPHHISPPCITIRIARSRWQPTADTSTLWPKWTILPMRSKPWIASRLESRSLPNERAFNPVAREDHQLFQVMFNGQHCVRVFSNPNIRDKLQDSRFLKTISDPTAELKFALECSTDSPPAAKPPEKSIAVLPFVNTSSTDQEYFSDGSAVPEHTPDRPRDREVESARRVKEFRSPFCGSRECIPRLRRNLERGGDRSARDPAIPLQRVRE